MGLRRRRGKPWQLRSFGRTAARYKLAVWNRAFGFHAEADHRVFLAVLDPVSTFFGTHGFLASIAVFKPRASDQVSSYHSGAGREQHAARGHYFSPN